ncbi:hypothetical protein [Haloactinopolyspora alba]|uniref:hypothetical protein n=1 Tax=Haloactinopolyspora alba TaxID=648780 RepID=UPI00197B04D7|nr:hypothetical protein [Haloactinopolyspora alba]
MMSRDRTAAAVVVFVALTLTGCSNSDEPEVPVVPTESSASRGSGETDDAVAEPTPSPTSTTGVPELCEELATAGDVAQILEVPMRGQTRRIYNDDHLEESGRTGRLTCRYGVRSAPDTPSPGNRPSAPARQPRIPLEFSVSGYVDAEVAAGRITSTVDAAQAAGTTVKAQSVAGRDGFLLSDKEDVSFIVADDIRTYVVTLAHRVVPRKAERVVLLAMAEHLLGIPSSTASAQA